MQLKFKKDRFPYKKDDVLEVKENLGAQLLSTGDPGSVEETEGVAKDKLVSRKTINGRIVAAQEAKAKKLRAKQKQIEEESK